MSLSVVSARLKQLADAAAAQATQANDPDRINAMQQAADQYRKLLAAVEEGLEELKVTKQQLADAGKRKAVAARRTGKLRAFEFWARHGAAVNAIVAQYGLSWKTRAPYGDTIVATAPKGWRSAVGERGGTVNWSPDHRMPAARFWPEGKLPDALITTPDYQREDIKNPRHHDAAWHHSRGYVWHRGNWCHEVEVRSERNRADAIEAAKRYRGEYPMAAE